MSPNARSLAFTVACMAVLCLAERGEEEGASKGAHALEAMQQKIKALQEKQNNVMSKLEAEAHAARSELTTDGRSGSSREVALARSALAAQVERLIRSLNAELRFLRSPEFPYANFKKLGNFVQERSNGIGKALDRMATILPDLKQKSDAYKRDSHALQAKVYKLQESIPKFINKVHEAKDKEVHELDQMNLEDAFSSRDRVVLQKATDADWKLIKNKQFKPLPHANFGPNPYENMSKDYWEHNTEPGLLDDKLAKEELQEAKAKMAAETNIDGVVINIPNTSHDEQPSLSSSG